MTSRHGLLLSLCLLAPSSVILACGSSVEVPGESGGGTTSTTTSTTGSGASTGSGTTGTGGTNTGTTGTGGTNTGGTGGFTGGSGGTNTGGTGTGGSVACGGINDEVGCLGAYPTCVPVYDDVCCPSCNPGTCSDCINVQFHHCAPNSPTCGVAPPSCGTTPQWACAGGKADCSINALGSVEPCHAKAGCTAAYCPVGAMCNVDPVCTPVTKGTCTALCDGLPPPCPPGTFAEANGSCYTGLCVPADVCGFQP